MTEQRFDLTFGPEPYSIRIDYHYCREIDEDGIGCHGTNPNHGYSWAEVKDAYRKAAMENISFYLAYWEHLVEADEKENQ